MALKTESIPSCETMIKIIRAWPTAQRFTLIQDVLSTLAPYVRAVSPRQPTLPQALGLLATNRPAPSDAEIAQWLDERRHERYGV